MVPFILEFYSGQVQCLNYFDMKLTVIYILSGIFNYALHCRVYKQSFKEREESKKMDEGLTQIILLVLL